MSAPDAEWKARVHWFSNLIAKIDAPITDEDIEMCMRGAWALATNWHIEERR